MMSGYQRDTRYSSDYEAYDAETTPQYTEYSGLEEDFEYPSGGGDNERWKWVAAIAGAVLTITVIATAVVLGGGKEDKPGATVTTPPLTPLTTPPPPPPAASTTPPPPPSSTLPPPPSEEIEAPPPSEEAPEPEPPARDPNLPPEGQVPLNPDAWVYYVSGNQTPGDLLTITYTDGIGQTRTVLGASLPWTMIVTPSPGVTGGSVTATSFASQINCSISNNQEQILASQNSNGIVARCSK